MRILEKIILDKKFLAGIAIILFLVVFFFSFFPEAERLEFKIVEISPGITAEGVARVLRDNGLIRNVGYFLFLAKLRNATNRLQSGIYKFYLGMSYHEIIQMLIKGKTLKTKLTVPEGFTASQIAELIQERKLGSEEIFLQIAKDKEWEGFLFPETYYISPGMTEEEIGNLMINQFNKIFTDQMRERGRQLKLKIKEVITLASMIEKEAKKDEERELVSAVFHNRLKKRMYLESCATILYALGRYKEKLRYKDLKVDSPYNTYTHFGLPPGPICNPGLKSIMAALYPTDSDVLFFVVDKGSGSHIFSRYYGEHLDVQKKRR